MLRTRLAVLVLASILFSLKVNGQPLDSLYVNGLLSVTDEKIFIHYDKEFYVAGETIWFKAYVYKQGKPYGQSHHLYLQLLSETGQIVFHGKYPILGAVSKGNIDLPDSIPQGNYYVRAYTPDQLNGEEDFIYKKQLFVYRPLLTGSEKSGETGQTLFLNFFPESGHLVDGILTVIGFKATDQWDAPVQVSGSIKTRTGINITGFSGFHDGMGRVQFKPRAGEQYVAEVETVLGKRSYLFPDVQPTGVHLKLQGEKGGLRFQLLRAEKGQRQFNQLRIIASIHQQVVYDMPVSFEDYPSVVGRLNTDSLPSGILRFTVFHQNGLPLAERSVFVNNGEYLGQVSLAPQQTGFGKREQNVFMLEFPEALQRSCSVSITALPGLTGNKEDIVSRMLLTGDVRGYVHNPAYYFESNNDSTKLALDNLMLTQGWGRYNWPDLIAGKLPSKKYADQEMISISGIVVDEKTLAPVNGGILHVYLEGADSTTQNFDLPLMEDGRFEIDRIAFMGNAKLYYAYLDQKEKQLPVMVQLEDNVLDRQNSLSPGVAVIKGYGSASPLIVASDQLDKRFRDLQSGLMDVKVLEEVTLQANQNKKPFDLVNERYTTGVFRGAGKFYLDNINEPINDRSMNVVDYIKNRIQQVELQRGRFVNRKNFSLMTGEKWDVGIFLNEQPVNITLLRTLRATDVALVKFFDAGFVGVGSSFPGGALAVYTKEKFVETPRPDKLPFVTASGYSVTREFYQPDYHQSGLRHPLQDNRSTLYWNPDIMTDDETRTVPLKFFNNDNSKRFHVRLQGFDANGKLLSMEKIIEAPQP